MQVEFESDTEMRGFAQAADKIYWRFVITEPLTGLWERKGTSVGPRSARRKERGASDSELGACIYKEVMSFRAWSSSSLMALYFSF